MVSNTVYSPTFSPFQASQYIYTSGTKQGFTIEKKKKTSKELKLVIKDLTHDQ